MTIDKAGPGMVRPVDRFGRLHPALRATLFAAMGAVAGLGQVPYGLVALTIASLVAVMLINQRTRGWKGAFLNGWAYGAGYFALTLQWIVEPFLVEADRYGWMAPFALVFMATGLALFWAAAFALARRMGRDIWLLVILWTGAEVLRALVLTGFPWVLIGHIWIDTPLAQLSALVGAHGLTLLTLALVAVIVQIGLRWTAVLPLAVVAALWLLLDPGPAPPPSADAPVVRLVQPNVPQAEKYMPDLVPVHFRRLVDLTGGGAVPDLVVWPEVALPWLLEDSADVLRAASDAARGSACYGHPAARWRPLLQFDGSGGASRPGHRAL